MGGSSSLSRARRHGVLSRNPSQEFPARAEQETPPGSANTWGSSGARRRAMRAARRPKSAMPRGGEAPENGRGRARERPPSGEAWDPRGPRAGLPGMRGGPHPQLNNRQEKGQSQRSFDPPLYAPRTIFGARTLCISEAARFRGCLCGDVSLRGVVTPRSEPRARLLNGHLVVNDCLQGRCQSRPRDNSSHSGPFSPGRLATERPLVPSLACRLYKAHVVEAI